MHSRGRPFAEDKQTVHRSYTKMNYRPTPFNLASIYFLYETVRLSVITVKLGDRADLGSLFIFYYLGIFLAIIFIDYLIQLAFFTGKWSWKSLYLTQILILVFVAIIIFPTIHLAG